MATVYLATDELTNSEVAVKLMSPRLVGRPEREQRFFNECRFIGRVGRHDNVVVMLGDGRINGKDGAPYLVMERVIGPSLEFLLAIEDRLGSERAARIALGVAKGLQATHAAGVVHRDVKPGNVVVAQPDDDSEVEVAKLLDFGLAAVIPDGTEGAQSRLTLHGQIPGSAGYMPPESTTCLEPDPSADVFGLGMLLVEILVGKPPYESMSRPEYLAEVTRDGWSLSQSVLDQIESVSLRSLVVACTRSDPRDRPTMAEVILRLEAVVGSAAVLSISAPRMVPMPEVGGGAPAEAKAGPQSRRAWLWVVIALLLLGGGVVIGVWMHGLDGKIHAGGRSVPVSLATSTTVYEETAGGETSEGGTSDAKPVSSGEGESSTSGADRDDEQVTTTGDGPRPPRSKHRRRRRSDDTAGDDEGGDAESGEPETPAPEPDRSSAECDPLRHSVAEMRREGGWSRIPFVLKANRACFGPKEYRRLLVEALARLGLNAECIEAAGTSDDPKIDKWVQQCKGNQP